MKLFNNETEYDETLIKEWNPLERFDKREAMKAIRRKVLRYFIAAVWLINGLFCKLLNLVPRHQQIVARILGGEHSMLLTKTIGGLEVLMAAWVLSRIQLRLCTALQILLVASMNIIEFILAPDLLLFGKGNVIVATGFVLLLLWYADFFQREPAPIFIR